MHLFHRWEAFLESAENPNFRFIISNTTEAGIRFSSDDKMTDSPPTEFPAKLTLWLYRRYQHFQGSPDAACIILPVELLLKNGDLLRQCILQNIDNWGLEAAFKDWIIRENIFCNTLVDRIVPGIKKEDLPKEWEKIDFQDAMMTQGEPFYIWVIEAPKSVREELPLDKAGLNVIFTDDLSPYRTRKVRILNGAHSSMVPVAYLYGLETVKEAVEDEVVGPFIRQAIFKEIIPSLDLRDQDLQQFAGDVLDRFKNPFIKHQLISIALNAVSKFETRVLPSILEYEKRKGKLPAGLVFSMAALLCFYKGEYEGGVIPLNDDQKVISFLNGLWENCDGSTPALEVLVQKVLEWEYAWKMDLSKIDGLKELLTDFLKKIEMEGFQKTLRDLSLTFE
jgi:tagaturonate reductase